MFRRTIIQLIFFIIQNPFLQNFFTGAIYKGDSKAICVPSLHCYSCPSMAFSCPIGTIQFIIDYAKIVPYNALGMLAGVGALFGSASCGYVCPFGLFQDLLYKISPFKGKGQLPKMLRYSKYFILLIFVILIPYLGHFPGFCAYICPSGSLGAGIPLVINHAGYRADIGITFIWKLFLLTLLIAYGLREQRPFCRYICPLGLILGFMNRFSIYQINLKPHTCRACKVCTPSNSCPMGLELPKQINSIDCIKCGECIKPCPFNAIETKWHIPVEIEKTNIKKVE